MPGSHLLSIAVVFPPLPLAALILSVAFFKLVQILTLKQKRRVIDNTGVEYGPITTISKSPGLGKC